VDVVVGDFKITEPLSNPVHGPPKQCSSSPKIVKSWTAVVGDFKITEPLSNPVHEPPKQFLNITEDGEILDGGDGDLSQYL
jgi:hypothetical protein